MNVITNLWGWLSALWDWFSRVERAPMAQRVDREIHRDQGVQKAREQAHTVRLLCAIEQELGRQQRRCEDGLPIDREALRTVLTMFRDMS